MKSYHSDEFFKAVAKNSTDLLSILNEQGIYEFVADSVTGTLGFAPEDLVGRSPLEFIHPDDQAMATSTLTAIFSESKIVSPAFRFRTKSGEYRWVITTISNMIENPHILGFVTNSRDVTETITALQKGLESDSYYRSLYYDHPDAAFTLDIRGFFVNANKNTTVITGFELEELIGNHFHALVIPEEAKNTNAAFEMALRGQAHSIETQIINKSGQPLDIAVTIIPVKIEDVVCAVLGIAKDITAFKVIEAAQLKADEELKKLAKDLHDQNTDLQQFTYIVSHNLRSPVANLLGLFDLMDAIDRNDLMFDEVISKARQSVRSLENITRDMNEILSVRNKVNTGDIEPIELLSFVQSLVAREFSNYEHHIRIDIPSDVTVRALKSYLYSVIYNLVSNAIKYRSAERSLEINVKGSIDGKNIFQLTVSDNGKGMNMEKVEKDLFKLYKRFHPEVEGRGMGLFIVKTQVEAMSGSIRIESEPDKGTTFYITIPQ